ncbi:hypothetical protein Q094_02973 [Pseudomonas aeruginosa PS42]|uniref:hypothetical protein n=1 Tax=Pseudomonas aeruginosa TaxID=287 RepID=UPI0004454BA0|nr:hypothetical protein [Pseudomonas aeruginosa]ETU92588.1 hypothetical protein Q094_02973 [Pseudomonas aeruginosa PS42]
MSQEQNKDMSQYFYRASAADFMKIPDAPIAYWLSNNAINSFIDGAPLADFADPRVGLDTGDNDLFIMFWHEVDYKKIGFDHNSVESFLASGKRYAPHTKGGDFRKWFGNIEFVLKFDAAAYKSLSKQGNKLPSKQFYFMPGSSWTRISSAKFSMRYNPAGFVFNSACPTLFSSSHENLLLATGVLLSPVSQHLLKALSPTLNFQAGDIRRCSNTKPEKLCN